MRRGAYDSGMPAPLPLSGVVVACNEADRIERCVASLRAVCAEVVVVDSGSRDATRERAAALGARIVEQPWLGFARQKNLAIAQATQAALALRHADEIGSAAPLLDLFSMRHETQYTRLFRS